MAESLHPGRMTQWIQYKLGKQYLWKKSYTTKLASDIDINITRPV